MLTPTRPMIKGFVLKRDHGFRGFFSLRARYILRMDRRECESCKIKELTKTHQMMFDVE